MSIAQPTPPKGQIGTGFATLCALCSVISVETGSALGKSLFSSVSPTTGVWLRYSFAALILWTINLVTWGYRRAKYGQQKPEKRVYSGWLWAGLYTLCVLTMNWTFYLGIERIPVGIGVTLQFLGPLAVAIIGSRRKLDLCWAGLAGIGVALLGFRPQSLDPLGVLFIMVAATLWAGYISIGAKASKYWDGSTLATASTSIGLLVFAIPAIHFDGPRIWHPAVLGVALLVGLFASALPMRLDMIAWGRIPPAVFAILQSLCPAVAATAGWILLGEALGWTDILAIAAVICASTGATISNTRAQNNTESAGE